MSKENKCWNRPDQAVTFSSWYVSVVSCVTNRGVLAKTRDEAAEPELKAVGSGSYRFALFVGSFLQQSDKILYCYCLLQA